MLTGRFENGDAAPRREMKVYMDIITNHTADVIQYCECLPATFCPYRGPWEFEDSPN